MKLRRLRLSHAMTIAGKTTFTIQAPEHDLDLREDMVWIGAGGVTYGTPIANVIECEVMPAPPPVPQQGKPQQRR